jgi:hypothetical protein
MEAIGLVIVNWAKAERTLTHALWLLLGDPYSKVGNLEELRLVAVTGMRDQVKAGLVKSAFRIRYYHLADRFDKLVDALLREGKRRDNIAHAWWVKGDRPDAIRAWIARPSNVFKVDEFEFTSVELRRLADRIETKRTDFVRFLTDLGFFPPLQSSDEK